MTALSSASPPPVKPRLRGVTHQISFFVVLVAAPLLVMAAPNARAALAAGVYGATLAIMFGVSALYHRPTWAPIARARMRRLDHSTIFLLIAGTYTPLALLGLGEAGHTLLAVVWCGAVLGVVQSIAWVHAPRGITISLYLLLGWSVVPVAGELARSVGGPVLALIVAGGALYSVGAVVYALRRPDPLPAHFGYHEIFHAFVVLAAVVHFVAVAVVVLRG